MDIETFKKKISKLKDSKNRINFIKMCETGENYYHNENEIKNNPLKIREDNPLKVADNRISHYWHGLLVNQKAGYMFGREPTIDVGDKVLNKEITKILGDEWGKTIKDLVINASNSGISWLHFWIDDKGAFQYGIVPSIQIYPLYSKDLKNRLIGVIREYVEEDENGNEYTKYEYWNDTEAFFYRSSGSSIVELNIVGNNETNHFTHSLRKVPFIYFNNNSILKYDLFMYKDLVDQFDKVTSGFANDIDDVQEIIFVLKGYGGEELEEFMKDLKDFKAVKTEDDGDVKTIRAEIPVEARDKFLESMKKSIFLFGMGVNPDKESLGDSSGVALKFLYSLLELKAAATRTEFDSSLKYLIRAILDYLGKNTDQDISITYYKNMVTNDKEVVEIISKSGNTISEKTKTKNHPYTDNLDEELEELEAQNQEEYDDYSNLGADANAQVK